MRQVLAVSFAASLLLLCLFAAPVWAQGTTPLVSLPTASLPTADFTDWATIGVGITAAISALLKLISIVHPGELSELTKRAISGVVCLAAAVIYGLQNGYFTNFDARNLISIIAAVGIVTTVAKNFYDGLSQPLGKLLQNSGSRNATPTALPTAPPVSESSFSESPFSESPVSSAAFDIPVTPAPVELSETMKDALVNEITNRTATQIIQHFSKE